MKTKLMVVALMAGATMFAQPRVSIGVGIGGFAPRTYAPAYVEQRAIPPSPGPGYVWVDGYWSQYGGRNSWVAGYWQRQPYYNSYQVAPRYVEPRFYNRYDNDRSRDFDRRRDFDRDRDHDRDRGRSYGNGFRNR